MEIYKRLFDKIHNNNTLGVLEKLISVLGLIHIIVDVVQPVELQGFPTQQF